MDALDEAETAAQRVSPWSRMDASALRRDPALCTPAQATALHRLQRTQGARSPKARTVSRVTDVKTAPQQRAALGALSTTAWGATARFALTNLLSAPLTIPLVCCHINSFWTGIQV